MSPNEEKMIKIANKLKPMISVGDLALHEDYGMGEVFAIASYDCWNPIQVKFTTKDGWENIITKILHFDASGVGHDPDQPHVKYYKRIKSL